MTTALAVPKRKPGRPTAAANERYQADLEAWCAALLELKSRSGFPVSARGWCYLIEPEGLSKADFDTAEQTINDCRKAGLLPLDFCADDNSRKFDGVEEIDNPDVEAVAQSSVEYIQYKHQFYTPISFWDDKPVYIQAVVEKIDLKSLFAPVCRDFAIPIANMKGWADISMRAAMMRRFAEHERAGRQCVLLACTDFDPAGLRIAEFLRSNMADVSLAVGWSPDNLIVDRFGLDFGFIEVQGLTWIDNLKTGSGGDLADPKHKDHNLAYVQDYLHRYCARDPAGRWQGRKVEANALVVRPQQGRQLCRDAILKYLSPDDPRKYRGALREPREELRIAIIKALQELDL